MQHADRAAAQAAGLRVLAEQGVVHRSSSAAVGVVVFVGVHFVLFSSLLGVSSRRRYSAAVVTIAVGIDVGCQRRDEPQ